MNNKIKFAVISCCAMGMTSCMIRENSTSTNLYYPAYSSYESVSSYKNDRLSYSGYDEKYNYSTSTRGVVVPSSYHLSDLRSPTSFREREQSWVNNQNPQAYTIEVAEGTRAAEVARALNKAPKNEHMAQLHYQRGGRTYYRGVYGSFNSALEAQAAFNALPDEVKQGASIKKWSHIKS